LARVQKSDEEVSQNLNLVKVDGMVILKIMKHCKQNLPEMVTGQLLGLASGGSLEVTNCFPSLDEEQIESSHDATKYQIETLKCLRQVNGDTNTVGWYQSTYLGSGFSVSMIEAQHTYQSKIDNSVVILYDPLQSLALGTLSLKAYRLSDEFMKLYPSSFDSKSLDKEDMTLDQIFTQVDVEVTNSHLIGAYLWDMEDNKDVQAVANALERSGASFMEKNVDVATEYLDELSEKQQKFYNYLRIASKQHAQQKKRKSENEARRSAGDAELPEDEMKATPPSRLDFLVTANQTNDHCQQVREIAGQNLTKLHLFKALARPESAQ